MQVFTLGYQRLRLEDYVDTLQEAGVGVVLDVRETPWSYNRRYIKSVMANALAESGIQYEHLRACGNPSSNRKTAASMAECLSRYRDYLSENSECLDELEYLVRNASEVGRPACLTCFERDPEECHRAILLDALGERLPAMRVVHLVPGEIVTQTTCLSPA